MILKDLYVCPAPRTLCLMLSLVWSSMWWGELRADRLRVRAGEDEGRCELGCVLGRTRVGGTWHEECTLECFVVLRVMVCLCVCVSVCACTLHGHAWLCSCVSARRHAGWAC